MYLKFGYASLNAIGTNTYVRRRHETLEAGTLLEAERTPLANIGASIFSQEIWLGNERQSKHEQL